MSPSEALNVILENCEASASTHAERIEVIHRVASRALAALNEGAVSGLTEERAGLAAIRARHDAALARMADNNWPMSEGRQDIAALLAIVDKMRADQ